MAEVATGSAARGLGNGRTWYRLPLWVQKSWGPWTSYGGGGRDFSSRLTLGGEVFRQTAQVIGGRDYTLANLGGYYNFTPDFSLLFSGGRSIAGEQHTVAYLGLYWTWGPRG